MPHTIWFAKLYISLEPLVDLRYFKLWELFYENSFKVELHLCEVRHRTRCRILYYTCTRTRCRILYYTCTRTRCRILYYTCTRTRCRILYYTCTIYLSRQIWQMSYMSHTKSNERDFSEKSFIVVLLWLYRTLRGGSTSK